jgi:hypothetical protein
MGWGFCGTQELKMQQNTKQDLTGKVATLEKNIRREEQNLAWDK